VDVDVYVKVLAGVTGDDGRPTRGVIRDYRRQCERAVTGSDGDADSRSFVI